MKSQFYLDNTIKKPSVVYANKDFNYPNGYNVNVFNEQGEILDVDVKQVNDNYVEVYVFSEKDGIVVNIEVTPK